VGDGGGLASQTSPTGGFVASVPMDLPSSRSGLPAPLQIVYTGTTRQGAAGSGWDVPLSYVRLSTSTMWRKPSVELEPGDPAARAPTRLFVVLDGAPALMVPSPTAAVFVPFAGDRYMELRLEGPRWVLEALGGPRYVFAHEEKTDPGLWLLQRI
jgi:hypothetical protein